MSTNVNKFFAGMFIFAVHCIYGMEDQRIVSVKNAIKSRNLYAFFAALNNVDHEWLKNNRQDVKKSIVTIRKEMVDAFPAIQNRSREYQEKWMIPFRIMDAGIDSLEHQFELAELDEMYLRFYDKK